MKYDKNKCDGCGRRFEDGDDIVVCPVCGTPQHRECYNLRGECVNASKHEQGFSWSPDPDVKKTEKDEKPFPNGGNDDELICPKCGKPNAAGSSRCSYCGQKFTILGFNVVEKQRDLEKEEQERLEGNDFDVGSDFGEEERLEHIIESRASVLAPGITDEQRREKLCGHSIVDLIAFVGNGAGAYVNKFRKIERDGRRTFNWGAFFFSPIWFFYRKLYKQGIVFTTIYLALTFIMYTPLERLQSFVNSFDLDQLNAMTEAQQATFMQNYLTLAAPVILLGVAQLALNLFCAFAADGMYHKYCTRSLFEVDRVKREFPPETARVFLLRSSTSLLFALIGALVCSFVPNLVIMLVTR